MSITVLVNAQTPIAHWKFEDNTLDEYSAAHGNIQPGDYVAIYSNDAIEGDKSIDFDGNYNLNALDPATLKNLDAFTITFWMKLDAATAAEQQSIFEKDGKFRIILLAGNLHFIVATENNGWYQAGGSLSVNPTSPTDSWVHIALYYTGSTLGLNVNGGYYTHENDANSITGKVIDIASGLVIGGGAGNFKGQLDDLRFYIQALSTEEISAVYQSNTLSNKVSIYSQNINLYPNPATSRVSLDNLDANSKIQIFTQSGQSVYKTTSISDKLSVDVSNLNAGVYFITIENETNKGVKKFIISK